MRRTMSPEQAFEVLGITPVQFGHSSTAVYQCLLEQTNDNPTYAAMVLTVIAEFLRQTYKVDVQFDPGAGNATYLVDFEFEGDDDETL